MTRYFTFDLSGTQKKKKQSSSCLFLFIKKKRRQNQSLFTSFFRREPGRTKLYPKPINLKVYGMKITIMSMINWLFARICWLNCGLQYRWTILIRLCHNSVHCLSLFSFFFWLKSITFFLSLYGSHIFMLIVW